MRKLFFTIFIILLFMPFISFAQNGETIRDFHSDIQVNQDASINVTENIQYDFGDAQRHGIFRYIPFRYQLDDGRKRLTSISDVSVKDERGAPYKFTKSENNDYLEIKIGDADKYVTGLKTYVISYKVDGAINYFDNQDELYWNVTGNDWPVQVEKVSATVVLPEKTEATKLNADSFVGVVGSKEKGNIAEVSETIDTIQYSSPRSLGVGDGLTIVTGFPKGMVVQKDYVYEVPFLSTLLGKVWLGANIILPILTFVVLFTLWRKKGRDPRGRGVIIAQYDAPDGVDPIAVGTLLDQKVDKKDISAGIIDLAVKGHLKINRLDGKGVFKTKDYELTKLKGAEGLNGYETKLLNALFEDGDTVKLRDLSTDFAKNVKDTQKLVFESLVSSGYFSKSPQKVRNIYMVTGFVVMFGGFIIMTFMPAIAVMGLVIMIFSFFMPARTLKGVTAKEHILGLREYLSVAEKDRIKFHNAPKKNPQTFEKFLPYAMALGVEKEWAKQFEGIFKENPTWYSDPSMRTFSAAAFATSVGDFSSSAGAVSVPAGSGGSGLGGGGASGGGFGGGGGGSW